MSMYDHVKFPYLMPDGTQGPDYQTKDLRYQMDMADYEVTQAGRLRRTSSDYDQPLGDISYGHTIAISAGAAVYELRFRTGRLHEIHCFQSGITAPFAPENFV
ncbi:hypothetical protein [Cupriavidus sp. IK-TO18]|uniref:hypothetical protein n=1 Tax=Cupriavidus sp. IK-TO18 TaxID=2782182 RepID=UPI001898781A|nr:hypothetical protein [Cupriavidus sp. IK-TO18]MBF6989290.1 hypothetical protein [Cupriavidus sp. IK-TO18]